MDPLSLKEAMESRCPDSGRIPGELGNRDHRGIVGLRKPLQATEDLIHPQPLVSNPASRSEASAGSRSG